MPFFVCYHALKPLRHGVGYVMCRGEQDFLPGLFEPSFQILHALGVGSLKTTSSIVLPTFSTGLMSGEFEGQHVFSIKFGRFFFFAPCLGGLGCVCWRPVLDERHVAIGTEQFSLVCSFIHIFTVKDRLHFFL